MSCNKTKQNKQTNKQKIGGAFTYTLLFMKYHIYTCGLDNKVISLFHFLMERIMNIMWKWKALLVIKYCLYLSVSLTTH